MTTHFIVVDKYQMRISLQFCDFTYPLYYRPGGIPARSEKGERLLLFIGIIDILQSYRLKKKLEHTFKSIIHDGVSNTSFITFCETFEV